MNVLLAVVISSSAQAQNISWANTAGGNWQDAAKRYAGIAPTNTYSVMVISNSSSKTVTVSSHTANSFTSTMIISNLAVSAPGE